MGSHFSTCLLARSSPSSLQRATFDSTPTFQPPSGICKVLDAYDADTCRVALCMPDNTLAKFTVRLHGIDAPERKPSKQSEHRDLEKKAAMRARARLLMLVTNCASVDLAFDRATAKEECGKSTQLVRLSGTTFDKYGRILGTLHEIGDSTSINDRLVQEGWVRAYDGGTRQNWTKKELDAILRLR